MPFEALVVALLVLLVVGYFAYRFRASGALTRKLWRDEQGSLVAIGERRGAAGGSLSGSGTILSDPLQLAAGNYRIDYQFATATRVALVDANGDETLFIKSGTGAEPLTIAASGRYRFLVEPADETAAWQLAYRPLGSLPHTNA